MVVGNVAGNLNFFTFPTATPSSAQIIDPASSSFINYLRMTISPTGQVVIGSTATPTGYNLFVEKGILTEKVKVAVKTTSDWSDFVFEKNYKLTPLQELEVFINKNKHLPGIPSAQEVVDNGINVAEMDAKLLQKIEELTLYMIEMKKENEKLLIETEKLKKDVNSLKTSK
jgi:hypothetical protein